MQIVIKIPEEQYNTIKSDLYNTFPAEMKKWGLEAIRNGTPLPKGHGRLIDADALWKKWVFDAIGKQEIDEAPTIIEAYNGESDEISDRNLKMWEEIFKAESEE